MCGDCKHMFTPEEAREHSKELPEDLLKNWDNYKKDKKIKVTKTLTCPNCKHEAVWERGTRLFSAGIARQLKMERTGWCTGLQRRYR